MFEPPFADEGLAPRLDFLARRRVDHVFVVGGDLIMQPLGRVRQEMAMFVDRAALNRHAAPHRGDRVLEAGRAIDDEELGPPQATPDEIIEHRTPSLDAFAAHGLDREQDLLAVGAHADDHQQRDRGRLAVKPHPHHSAVEDQSHDRFLGQRARIPGVPVAFHLAPHPADRVFAHRAGEQACQRAAHTTRVGGLGRSVSEKSGDGLTDSESPTLHVE
jgi:hypothetical protein